MFSLLLLLSCVVCWFCLCVYMNVVGASGTVRLDSNGDRFATYGIQNFRPEKNAFGIVGLVDMISHEISYSQPIIFRDGSNVIPSDHEPLPSLPIYQINTSLQIPLYVFAFVITACIIGVAGLIIVQRQLSLFKVNNRMKQIHTYI